MFQCCFGVVKTAYNPFYDGKFFENGDRCNGFITEEAEEITFHAVGADGKVYERNDEMPSLTIQDLSEKVKITVDELKSLSCANCNEYKPQLELKKYGEIIACKKCRNNLEGEKMKKSQMSFFWEQKSLF